MAKKEEKIGWSSLMRELDESGPTGLFLLYGPEEYLKEQYVDALKKQVLGGETDDFSYHRLDGSCTPQQLSDAVNAMPFLSRYTLTEVRGFDFNRCTEENAAELEKLFSDLPEWCALIFIMGAEYDVDWRRKLSKSVKKYGRAVQFTSQEQSEVCKWIRKRFAALGKTIDAKAAAHLTFTSGELMSGLVPEIEKLAFSVAGDTVTVADIEKFAHHIPEAHVFAMTDALAVRDFDGAARELSELLASGEEPVKTIGAIGLQFRKLYAAGLAREKKLGEEYIVRVCKVSPYVASRLMSTARGFTLPQLIRAVELCAETAYAMNSSGTDAGDLLKLFIAEYSVGLSA